MQDRLVAVIDDDDLVRDAAASLIRSFGYRTATYASGEAYLAADPAPDCVLTDLQMPGRSGVELCAELRARGSPVPILLMTAYPTAALRSRLASFGLAALLEKPLDPDVLHAAVAAAVP